MDRDRTSFDSDGGAESPVLPPPAAKGDFGGSQGKQGLHFLLVTSLYPPAVGGAAVAFSLFAKYWQREERVARILVLTEKRNDSPRVESLGKQVIWRMLPRRDTIPRRSFPWRAGRFLLTNLALCWWIPRLAGRYQLDIIILHGRFGRRWLIKPLKLLRKPVVSILADLVTPPCRLRDCAAIVCLSENTFASTRLKLGSPPHVHHVPLAFEPLSPLNPEITEFQRWKPFLLCVGQVSRKKGVDQLLHAFQLFSRKHPGYKLLLVGPLIDADLRKAGDSSVIFFGPAPPATVQALISRAELLACVSQSEGLPRVCLEAINLGKKVIIPPGIPELERACPELVLKNRTAEAIAEKLEEVLYSYSGKAAFPFSNHDPARAAQRVLEICQALLPAGKAERACQRAALPHELK